MVFRAAADAQRAHLGNTNYMRNSWRLRSMHRMTTDSRKAPRYALRCRAEINDWTAVDDCLLRNVSLRGCYVETLPVGSEVDILIFVGDRTVRAGAKVRFVRRARIGKEVLVRLDLLLAELVRGAG